MVVKLLDVGLEFFFRRKNWRNFWNGIWIENAPGPGLGPGGLVPGGGYPLVVGPGWSGWLAFFQVFSYRFA